MSNADDDRPKEQPPRETPYQDPQPAGHRVGKNAEPAKPGVAEPLGNVLAEVSVRLLCRGALGGDDDQQGRQVHEAAQLLPPGNEMLDRLADVVDPPPQFEDVLERCVGAALKQLEQLRLDPLFVSQPGLEIDDLCRDILAV